MENVVLTIHLILALLLIGVVLLQRSEGGGLGMGGGGAISARGAATALGKITWVLAAAFIVTSITLTILAAGTGKTGSVADQIGIEATKPATEAPATDLLPPAPADAPATPEKAEN
ncbi:MAG: preprotein translocase subunit SecG [Pseudorhodobacter sp.]|nr:MAG: preprotein translocase subunit SecG [Pseudorhodobacter sp.]